MNSFLHLLSASSVCTVAVIGYGFWYAAVDAKSVAVATLESQVIAKTTTVNRVASSRASLAGIRGDEVTIWNYFVPETGVVAFIDALQVRGEARGATVDVLSVSSAGTATPEQSLVLSLSVSGTFGAVMGTVGAIEYAPYNLRISELSITKGKDEWRASLTILVGSVSATQSATDAPAPSPAAFAPPPLLPMHIFDSFGSFIQRLRSGASVDPVRDWLVLLIVAMVAFMGIIIWNVWAFDTVAGGGTLRTQTTKAPTVFNNSSLDTIHTIFLNRADEEGKYRTGTYRYIDPSQ